MKNVKIIPALLGLSSSTARCKQKTQSEKMRIPQCDWKVQKSSNGVANVRVRAENIWLKLYFIFIIKKKKKKLEAKRKNK